MKQLIREQFLKYIFLFFILLCSIAVIKTYAHNNPQTTNEHTSIFWIQKVIDEKSINMRVYSLSSEKTFDISDLEIWQALLDGTQNVDELIFWDNPPDVKWFMLIYGYAKIKDEKNASDNYLKAQEDARINQRGLWAVPTSNNSNPLLIILGWDWNRIFHYIIVTITFFGFIELIRLFLAWLKRHRMPLIIIGRPSTGKSWLWSRLLDPDIGNDELLDIKRSSASVVKKLDIAKAMGRFEIFPIFIDTPGGNTGEQVNKLIRERSWIRRLQNLLFRQKVVWIIMLATTQDSQIEWENKWEEKFDHAYIEQQLGYLDLPVGILSSNKTIRPDLVIVCLSKFDLFSQNSPHDTTSKEYRDILGKIFNRHIERVKIECANNNIPFHLVFCSALKGWGIDDILRIIEKALFSK